jgi:hypothetical protein
MTSKKKIEQALPHEMLTKIGSFIRPKTSFGLIKKILVVFHNFAINAPNFSTFELFFDRGIVISIDKMERNLKFNIFFFQDQDELECQYVFIANSDNRGAKIRAINDLIFLLNYIMLNIRIKRLDVNNNDYIANNIQAVYQMLPSRQLDYVNINNNILKNHDPSGVIKKTLELLNVLRHIESSKYYIHFK